MNTTPPDRPDHAPSSRTPSRAAAGSATATAGGPASTVPATGRPAAFVLVPGGWLGGWAFERVAARLRDAGHPAIAVDLSGDDLTARARCVADVLERLAADGRRAVVVGHCYGLWPAVGAVDRYPQIVDRYVGVDTGVPINGLSALDVLAPDRRARIRTEIDTRGGGCAFLIPPPEETPEEISLAGISEADVALLYQRATPQPVAALTEPLRLTGAFEDIPASAVFCTLGEVRSIDAARAAFATGEPVFARLGDPATRYFELESGHYPMFTAPDALADVLLEAAAGGGRRLFDDAPA